ncbi:hypothetical protein N7466_000563 [Penicillium verhagenii]|uniref:uncharacterized protein n=1 Tax=Penicillium verhagenii TaxID=1562060 RepID=UPI00254557FB|nr:uncharacterized protein N7466_000563 [Penicillium verhagenii]KAJ5947548.1 hypothetical protein N7466_000563 [Penicillium verhagenii]
METSPKASLSPLPPPSFTSAASSPRKRSIHEVDGVTLPSVGPKRALTTFTENNQENDDPALTLQKDSHSLQEGNVSASIRPVPQVVIPARTADQSPVARTVETTLVPSNTVGDSNQGSPVKSDLIPAKKRKLSPASKEAKEKQRLEEKAKKDEEKRLKDEEKRLKDEEKRIKDKQEAEQKEEKKKRETEQKEEKKKKEAELKEEKKKAKEAREDERRRKDEAKENEKRQKEEAKLKKERAQPKLNSFFAKPQVPASPAKKTSEPKAAALHNDAISTSQATQSDYAKAFPDFFLQSHTILAPPHRFERDADALAHVRSTIDSSLNPGGSAQDLPPFRPSEVFNIIPYQRRCGRQAQSVKDILQLLHSYDDVANQPHLASKSAKSNLSRIPMKSLKFGEDVRPAYQGTFTRAVPRDSAYKVSRNPYRRDLPETNYDYDSEAEWEEPEEGEDLDSEEEEEASDEGEDDMDEFLDDEDDALKENKRRLIVGDLEPNNTGIRWATDGVDEELKGYKMEVISDAVKFPIDPFSTAYWQKPRAADQVTKARVTQKPTSGSLDVFRVPTSTDAAVPASALPPPPTFKAKRPFPPEQLSEFKEAVEGSDLSKIGLVEILKKRFPKVSKDTLKATLDQVAARVGQKEVDKKWVCR